MIVNIIIVDWYLHKRQFVSSKRPWTLAQLFGLASGNEHSPHTKGAGIALCFIDRTFLSVDCHKRPSCILHPQKVSGRTTNKSAFLLGVVYSFNIASIIHQFSSTANVFYAWTDLSWSHKSRTQLSAITDSSLGLLTIFVSFSADGWP